MPKKLQIHREETPEAKERHDRLLAELEQEGFKQEWLAPKTASEQAPSASAGHTGKASGSGDTMPSSSAPA